MSASSQSQGKTVEKSPGLLIHCHGGGFVAQSSASHEVSQSQGKTVEKSPGLLIHCHGGGFVAQSSASHEVS